MNWISNKHGLFAMDERIERIDDVKGDPQKNITKPPQNWHG